VLTKKLVIVSSFKLGAHKMKELPRAVFYISMSLNGRVAGKEGKEGSAKTGQSSM
jgi:hypothetical protein